MEAENFFEEAQQDDLCLTFGPFQPKELPLKQAAVKTAGGWKDLEGSITELGTGILLAVQSKRCCGPEIFAPLDQRQAELDAYRKQSCTFRRNGDCNSNFFALSTTGDSVVWVRNEGERSLRFQTQDGTVFRVCAGHTEVLTPANLRAQVSPIQVLLDLNNNQLDLRVGAVYVRYGRSPWQQGGVDCHCGAHVDSYFCRVFCGDDCLGVLESHSSYFLARPQLKFLDIETYGVNHWFVRNKGEKALTLTWSDGKEAEIPADRQIYRLEVPSSCREGEDK